MPGSFAPHPDWMGPVLRQTLLFAATVVLSGCADLLVESYRYGTLEVDARTRLGVAVEGVSLLLYQGEEHIGYGRTDLDGNHVFENVPFGNLGILAIPPDDHATPDLKSWLTVDGVQMDEGSSRTVPIELRRCRGTMSVSVVDGSGMAVHKAFVLVYRSDGASRNATTDAEGRALVENLPCGSIGVRVAAPEGYSVLPWPGGNYIDGLTSDGEGEIAVEFTVARD